MWLWNTYLNEVGFKLFVDHHVKAEYLEAGTASYVVREAGTVVVFEDGMSRDKSLNDHIVNITPHLINVITMVLQPNIHRR